MNTTTHDFAAAPSGRSPNPNPNATAVAAAELRAWLNVVDAALRVIEETAWEARRVSADLLVSARGDIRAMDAQRRELLDLRDRVARATQCGWVLTKIASSYRLHLTRAAFSSKKSARRSLDRLHQKNAERFRDLCMAQGGAFLKVGQLLSARPDLLPESWTHTLACLQDDAPPVAPEAIVATLEAELGAVKAAILAHIR